MSWLAQAPSNIALIKYMGKLDAQTNTPINASLSYTLPNLLTTVVLNQHAGKTDEWEPLANPSFPEFTLSKAAQERFLRHLAYVKKHFQYEGAFIVQSSNNFPHSSGLASSASSFAALTKSAALALSELTNTALPSVAEQAQLSRVGSGSSCRSFFSPWALWNKDEVSSLELPYPKLIHQAILVSQSEKKVSSSEAHQRIQTSPHYATRAARAEANLSELTEALQTQDWRLSFELCWREFEDLHRLFETSTPAFSYRTPQTQELLQTLQAFWERQGDGPLITMDAGPNIHLLYRLDQTELALQFKHDHLVNNYDVL